MIQINNLKKIYGEKTVIDRLSLTLPDSGVIAVCGPSGCGKSTLLRILSGLDHVYEGTIAPNVVSTAVSFAFQEPALLPWRSALQNVNIVLGDHRETLGISRDILSELGIDTPDMYPDEMSGGMKARVGIARALVHTAPLYLLDEPFASLDIETAQIAANTIRRHTVGKLVITVLHDKDFALTFADNVLIFRTSPMSGFDVIGAGLLTL